MFDGSSMRLPRSHRGSTLPALFQESTILPPCLRGKPHHASQFLQLHHGCLIFVHVVQHLGFQFPKKRDPFFFFDLGFLGMCRRFSKPFLLGEYSKTTLQNSLQMVMFLDLTAELSLHQLAVSRWKRCVFSGWWFLVWIGPYSHCSVVCILLPLCSIYEIRAPDGITWIFWVCGLQRLSHVLLKDPPGNWHIPSKGSWEDEFPFPLVGYGPVPWDILFFFWIWEVGSTGSSRYYKGSMGQSFLTLDSIRQDGSFKHATKTCNRVTEESKWCSESPMIWQMPDVGQTNIWGQNLLNAKNMLRYWYLL